MLPTLQEKKPRPEFRVATQGDSDILFDATIASKSSREAPQEKKSDHLCLAEMVSSFKLQLSRGKQ